MNRFIIVIKIIVIVVNRMKDGFKYLSEKTDQSLQMSENRLEINSIALYIFNLFRAYVIVKNHW